jgi:nucleotide-binding universal stress UspA family protein
MDQHGIMILAYVEPRRGTHDPEYAGGVRTVQAAGVEVSFEQVINELAPTAGMSITHTTLRGDPVEELKTLAEKVNPDLVAIGSQRHGWLERLLLGSVTSAMVRDGRWSMLVVPPARRPVEG